MSPRARRTDERPAIVRNRRGIATRKTILDAAQRLLNRRGIEAVSLDAVAKAAGVSRSSVYHQFHSRDGLFLELIAESFRRLQAERIRPLGRLSSLERFFAEAEAGFHADPELLRTFYLLIFDRSRGHPEVRRMLTEAYRFRTRRIAAGLTGEGGRMPRERLETMATLLAAILDGLYARRQIDLGGRSLKRAFVLAAELLEHGLRNSR